MTKQTIKTLLNNLSKAAGEYDATAIEALSDSLIKELAAQTQADPEHSVSALGALALANDTDRIKQVSSNLAQSLRDDPTPVATTFIKELSLALDQLDKDRVAHLCQKLRLRLLAEPARYTDNDCIQVLGLLRKKRYFDAMIDIADVAFFARSDDCEQHNPTILRLYAQALLDTGKVSNALELLKSLKYGGLVKKGSDEYNQIYGLIGRAYKQVFSDIAASHGGGNSEFRRNALKKAVDAYASIYHDDPSQHWHGVNVVALLARAERDGLSLTDPGAKDYRDIARCIHASIASEKNQTPPAQTSKYPLSMWDCANAAEACLADESLYEQAVFWTARYTSDTYNVKADAFEYASTLRQFEQIWQLDPEHELQGKVLELLRSALIRKQGSRINIDQPAQQLSTAQALSGDERFEAVLGSERYKTLRWYELGLKRAKGVARIIDKTNNALGTGFLLRGQEVDESFADEWVILTNAHVISDNPDELHPSEGPAARLPQDVEIVFDTGLNKGQNFRAVKLVYSSGRFDLDCSIVTIAGGIIELDDPVRIARNLPPVNKEQRVYIIGHPKGGGLAFSIDDNLLLDHDTTRIHYRAPTEPGSSGSPVFNRDWDLIGLHHYGGQSMKRLNNQTGTYPANEGIAIQKILTDARQHLRT